MSQEAEAAGGHSFSISLAKHHVHRAWLMITMRTRGALGMDIVMGTSFPSIPGISGRGIPALAALLLKIKRSD